MLLQVKVLGYNLPNENEQRLRTPPVYVLSKYPSLFHTSSIRKRFLGPYYSDLPTRINDSSEISTPKNLPLGKHQKPLMI